MPQVIVFISLFISFCVHASFESIQYPINKLKKVNLYNASGKITVYSSDAEEITIEFEKLKFPQNCDLNINQSLKELTIEVDENRNGKNDESCVVNFRIRVPESIDLNVKNGFGPLDILGLKSNINYALGSGNVELDGEFQSINGRLGSGDFVLRGFSKKTKIKSGNGSVKFAANQTLKNGRFELNNGMGDFDLIIPADSDLKVNFESGIGRLRSELVDYSKNDGFSIQMKSGTGNLSIKKN